MSAHPLKTEGSSSGDFPAGSGDDCAGANDLRIVNAELRSRLEETEEMLMAIRRGDVDGVVIGDDLYILDSANAATNRMRTDVLAQMEDAVLAFDADDHVIFMNEAAERQYGRSASDALGHPRLELYREHWPDVQEQHKAQAALEANGAFRAHSIHMRNDGYAMHVESTVSPLRAAMGERVGHLSVIRDITNRVRVEETLRSATLALQDADRRKDEFIATLAHELRNPLAPIRNAVQIMQLTSDPTVHGTAREIIQRQLGHMVHLVEDLLDVSRISQGKIDLRRSNVDIAQVVRTAIETSRPAIDGARHELIVDVPEPKTLIVDGDLTRLCQIVANLLNNAAKYTPHEGKIAVAAERQGECAVITIRDSGVGISQEMLPRIFEMFAQIGRSVGHSQGGLGIGLALVKKLTEMHGGAVSASSEGLGQGSTFVVRIPALADGVASDPSPGHLPERSVGTRVTEGCRVLIVDDNVDSAESLAQVLQMLGYEVRTANDGVSAVELAQVFAPRAVFLDIGLPRLNGLEAAKQIRQLANCSDALLVALSGWGQEEDLRKSKDAGFNHHFVKPVDVEALTVLLRKIRPQS